MGTVLVFACGSSIVMMTCGSAIGIGEDMVGIASRRSSNLPTSRRFFSFSFFPFTSSTSSSPFPFPFPLPPLTTNRTLIPFPLHTSRFHLSSTSPNSPSSNPCRTLLNTFLSYTAFPANTPAAAPKGGTAATETRPMLRPDVQARDCCVRESLVAATMAEENWVQVVGGMWREKRAGW